MTLIQLQYFKAVCKYQNFTKAAEVLHISQPAMSAAMKDLENECGVPLFLRDKNSLKITEEGHILLEETKPILEQFDHLNYVVKKLSLSRKYIRIGLSTLSGNQVYPRILQEFRRRYPDIQMISVEEATSRQFEMLDSGLLDFVITVRQYDDPAKQKKFDSIYHHWAMVKSCQYFCVGKENPLAKQSFVTMEQISKEPLVMLKDNFNQSRRIKEKFEEKGLPYQVMHYTDQMYTLERFIEQNIAAGFLPKEVAENNSKLVGIPYDGSEIRHIEVFWRKDRFLFTAPNSHNPNHIFQIGDGFGFCILLKDLKYV